MLLTLSADTELGGIRSTTVKERSTRAERFGSRTARAHTLFAPRCGGRRLAVHDFAQAATSFGGGPYVKWAVVTSWSETSSIVACLCRMPLMEICPCWST